MRDQRLWNEDDRASREPAPDMGEVLGWGDAFQADTGELKPLADGPARFRVAEMRRERYEGGEKLPACPVAELTLSVTDVEGNTGRVQDKLFLARKMLFKITSFGRSTHLIPTDVHDGQTFVMPWDRVVGAEGTCVITHREWTGRDGARRTSPAVERYTVDQ